MAVVGTIIGAGFVTGKEIATFFSRFGNIGIATSILAFPLFIFAFYVALTSKQNANHTKTNIWQSAVFFLANWVVSLAMVSASVSVLSQLIPLPHFVMLPLFFLLQFFVLLKDAKAYAIICAVLIPLLIVFLLYVAFQSIVIDPTMFEFSGTKNSFALWFCIIYVATNFLIGYPIFGEIGKKMKRKEAIFVAIASSAIIVFVIAVFNFALLGTPNSVYVEMPVFVLFASLSPLLIIFIKSFAFLGMITTLFATQQGILKIIDEQMKTYHSRKTKSAVVCLMSLIGCLINFSQIVEVLYPMLGVIGLFLFFILYFKPNTKSSVF